MKNKTEKQKKEQKEQKQEEEEENNQKLNKNKKIKYSSSSVLENIHLNSFIEMHKSLHDYSKPYPHSFLYPLINDSIMRTIYNEAKNNMTATFKETDLFKLFQTCDLANLSETDELAIRMPELMKLRTTLYSREFRDFIMAITGCNELTDRVDCAANVYSNSCHLMCHDDVIGTRCVSYIIYLTDPDEEWLDTDGGALELYPLEQTATIYQDELQPLHGIPACVPEKRILPIFNSMALFIVQPGRSYHAVQEVYCSDKPRLSIQGWYHAATPPVGSNFASLQQILSKDELDTIPAVSINPEIYSSLQTQDVIISNRNRKNKINKNNNTNDNDNDHDHNNNNTPITDINSLLSQSDINKLLQWMNPDYLTIKSIKQIQDTFLHDSSIQLNNFLNSEISQLILDNLIEADEYCKLGKNRPSMNYAVGQTGNWIIKGPPHKQRYMIYHKIKNLLKKSQKNLELSDPNTVMGEILSDLYNSLLSTPEFLRYLYIITNIPLTSYHKEIRRFRCGLDYTVANLSQLYHSIDNDNGGNGGNNQRDINGNEDLNDNELLKKQSNKLDITLCFINNKLNKYKSLWNSGDIGGYECYISTDDDLNSAATAEIYQVNDENNDTELLSIHCGFNQLNIVLRDYGVLKFIKFVSYRAPSSRWDVSMEFMIDKKYYEDDGDDDNDDEDDEEEEDSGDGSEDNEEDEDESEEEDDDDED